MFLQVQLLSDICLHILFDKSQFIRFQWLEISKQITVTGSEWLYDAMETHLKCETVYWMHVQDSIH